MSYQSKYTGQEIDELLDKVSVSGGNVTTLFEGAFTAQNSTLKLLDNITNYDALVMVPYIQGSTGKKEKNPMWIVVNDINYSDQEEYCCYMDISPKENYWYSIRFGFATSGTEVLTGIIYKGTGFSSNEIGIKNIYGIKFRGGDTTLTGNIISFMGTKAPKGYLICDGAEYNIADYPKLASHFEEQFEDVGYFGGDGIATFKVPDLRNEFLRGQGELSGNIGEHQDATQLPAIYASNYGKNFYTGGYDFNGTGNTNTFANTDTVIKNKDLGTDTSKYGLASTTDRTANLSSKWADVAVKYTTRPTNVAVLYCIKY